MRTPRPAAAAAPRFPVLRGRISADGTATLDGRTVDADARDPKRALLAAAAATAGLYGHPVRLHLTDVAGRNRRLVVSPDGPAYPESTRQRSRRPRRDHPTRQFRQQVVNPTPSGYGGCTGTPVTWTDFPTLPRPTAAGGWRIPTLEQTG